jgi:hypothetical protein
MTHTTTEPRIRVRLTNTELRRARNKQQRRAGRLECKRIRMGGPRDE